MNFVEMIKKDMYSAMKSGEKEKAGTLRTLLAKLILGKNYQRMTV